MDFRRIPFQFSTTDPAKRQEELRKRFGLPANTDKMYLDLANSGTTGAKSESFHSASSSPRFQHRVPIFVEGSSEPVRPPVETQNVDASRKPHVRVIPIEIEGETGPARHHRTLSGPSKCEIPIKEPNKHPVVDPSIKLPKAPRICNIPIKIEGGGGELKKPKSPTKTPKVKSPVVSKGNGAKPNGCNVSKVSNVPEKKPSPEQVALEKIEGILQRLNGYQADVEQFVGTDKDKKYRYLDEMLTRCMIELDGIDTMGIEAIRLSRKNAVRKVQACIDLLETKVCRNVSEISAEEPMEVESLSNENLDVSEAVVEPEEEKVESVSDGVEAISSDTGIKDQPLQSTEMDVDAGDNIDVPENNPSSGAMLISGDVADSEVVNMQESVSDKVADNTDIKVSDQSPQSTESDVGVKLEIDVKKGNVTVSDGINMDNVPVEERLDLEVTDNQPVQITEMDTGMENASVMETEPVIEEPLSDSPSHDSLSDANSGDSSSFKVCEVKDGVPEAESCEKFEDPCVSNIPSEVKQNSSTITHIDHSSTASETSASLETDVKSETSVSELLTVDKNDSNPSFS